MEATVFHKTMGVGGIHKPFCNRTRVTEGSMREGRGLVFVLGHPCAMLFT